MAIIRRYECYEGYDSRIYCRSAWNDWGRWVALAVIIVCAFIVFFAFACVSARRRRRQGLQPFHGTGWAAHHAFWQQQQHQQQYQQPYPNAPPPQYSPAGGFYGPKPTYFGGHQNPPQEQGVEMQPPQNTYRAGEPVYQPPPGPPPAAGNNK
ncbi:hypothetical protein AJ79_06421 [Helicocarpus griseus UAMH5409]|uniref:Uncharacterized protein n=1 Tax=Helicocarpus griseus UAMH5409 TaxID=1447875 RepID=A0A2B7XE59_9EURO|nr:hypothetical protein AJ79_06421 [Helicocarpus griseus UAMH5409]